MTSHFPDHALYLGAETLVMKDKKLWKTALPQMSSTKKA